MEPVVSTERRGRVLLIAMQREHKRNAVDRQLADELDAALNVLDDDPELWVGVLTGTPNVFSAGSDLTAAGDNVTERGGEYGIIRRVRRKPLVAAVEGFALGGGMEIVFACDLVVASTAAEFGLPEVARGLVATSGALFRAARLLPVNLAKELLLTGERIGAARAHAAGLVNRLAEPGQAVEVALALAEQITANGPVAVQASMTAVNALLADGDERGWEATSKAMGKIAEAEDTREGVAAFFERRAPQWKGR
ncbi:MAG: enoyl-CoA hydratase/isomerase family protein [Acidimicrobiia bacterium]|nr:enoyl-CoA hydratase/isomerase family protein [Acidimicrobiia bacterium]